jgi:hypothetical protein
MKRQRLVVTLILLFFMLESSLSDLIAPPAEKDSGEKPDPANGSNERKSAKGLEDEKEEDTEVQTEKKVEDFEQFSKFMSNEFNFPGSAIKIVKAPDLSKDKETKKVSETITMLLENQEKWIQKIESELDEINKNEEAQSEQTPKEKTPEEIEGKSFD